MLAGSTAGGVQQPRLIDMAWSSQRTLPVYAGLHSVEGIRTAVSGGST